MGAITGRRKVAALVAAVVVVAAGLLAGYELRLFGVTPPPGIALTDLHSIDQLQSLFNAGQGSPRLLLIMSPT
jgi:hypothetical protein